MVTKPIYRGVFMVTKRSFFCWFSCNILFISIHHYTNSLKLKFYLWILFSH